MGYILFNIAFSHSLSDFCSGGHCSGQLLLPRRPVDGPGHWLHRRGEATRLAVKHGPWGAVGSKPQLDIEFLNATIKWDGIGDSWMRFLGYQWFNQRAILCF